jgi:hypothetical protein
MFCCTLGLLSLMADSLLLSLRLRLSFFLGAANEASLRSYWPFALRDKVASRLLPGSTGLVNHFQ